MKQRNQERRRDKRYQLKKSPVVFCSSLIGKVADISMGGIKMIHTGRPFQFLGKIFYLSILGRDFVLEFPARLVGYSKGTNSMANLCRFEFDMLSEEKKEELRKFLAKNTYNLSHQP